ncbi:GDSL-like protein [SAR86 cluster bacterium SAR86E]|uniref:GDSL-like protein n=1 Tax=SAR86 cluster bacterium SAR86E TaxID=1208365 RepID=K6G736_9GAMM|nr:GDSL-like protein [SAR86 cluster bacterium SAR86E]
MQSFKISLFIFLLILLAVPTPVNSFELGIQIDNKIVILGDSLSAGYGVSIDESWPSLLQKRMRDENHNISIINAGISGDTTSGGLYRLPELLNNHNPSLVILELGGNDGLRGMSIKNVIKKNLISMIELIQSSNSNLVLIGVELPPNYGQIYTNQFKKMYSDLAQTYDVALVNGSLVKMVEMNLMQADGIHPNPEGHKMIEHEVSQVVIPIIQSN